MPGPEIVRSIYVQMIQGHLSPFDPDVARMGPKLTDATIDLHKTVMNNFLPSSVKFHYQFNLREMSNITQVPSGSHCCLMHMCVNSSRRPPNITANIAGTPANDQGYLQATHEGHSPVEA
jgi:hypothetical protein